MPHPDDLIPSCLFSVTQQNKCLLCSHFHNPTCALLHLSSVRYCSSTGRWQLWPKMDCLDCKHIWVFYYHFINLYFCRIKFTVAIFIPCKGFEPSPLRQDKLNWHRLDSDSSAMRSLRSPFSILSGETATCVKASSCSSVEPFEELHQTQKIIFQQLAAQ